jgi:integrase
MSDERCTLCGSKFKDGGRALVCPNHPTQKATSFRVKIKGVRKRFHSYAEAFQFLTGLRYKVVEGSFDPRDYKQDNPLGFENLAQSWLKVKRKQVKERSWSNLNNYIRKASGIWGQRNIKEIGYAEIEDFLTSLPLSDKSRANARSVLHSFWTWLRKRRALRPDQFPEFPEVNFELGFRNTIDKPTQEVIIEEVKRISYGVNPRIWLGIKWLSTYFAVRPGELLGIKEKEIDLKNEWLWIPHPKEKRPKTIPLLAEDIKLLTALPRGLPDLPFFRHLGGIKGTRPGQRFGPKYLYVWWKRACANLGIEGVDLYGGTRHSTVRALRRDFSPERIKKASMHSTNKAFERYFQMELEDVREVYARTQKADKGAVIPLRSSGPKLGPNFGPLDKT